jgi:uncharacterized protein YyaL (SSP411 family)
MDEATAFRFSPRPNRAREIRWRTWGPDAFKEAERDGKPLLLAISAVWCHWCHVMDETTYSDPQVIRLINEHFIPVRVDNDVRPDVNLRYNMGGWPSTALLTAAGEVITGSTYVPPEQMLPLLEQVRAYYAEHRAELQNQHLPVDLIEPRPTPTDPTPEPIATMDQALQHEFDRAYGGVGSAAKFPQPEVWELALARFVNEGQGWMAGMAVRTMDAMAGSALHDGVAGGFFRYSTTREWTMPHFEKMLEDNARLATLYLHAYQVLGDEYYRTVARTTLDWIRTTLQQPNGLFGGSQDADEAYYRLSEADRANRPAPYVDPTAYAGANGAAVSAMLLGAAVVDERFRAEGLTALEAIFTELWDPEVGLYHDDRDREVVNWLGDLTAVGHACLDAHLLTGDAEHLTRAEQLMGMMERDLGDGARPGYFDRPAQVGDFGRLAVRQKPIPANAEAARLSHRLARIKRDEAGAAQARGMLGSFGEAAMRFALFAAPWGLAYQSMTAPPLDAVIVTDDNPHDGLPFRRAVHQLYSVNTAVRAVDVMDPEAEEAGYDEDTVPALYLCRGTVCSPPIQNPADVIGAYRALLAQPGGPTGPRLVT